MERTSWFRGVRNRFTLVELLLIVAFLVDLLALVMVAFVRTPVIQAAVLTSLLLALVAIGLMTKPAPPASAAWFPRTAPEAAPVPTSMPPATPPPSPLPLPAIHLPVVDADRAESNLGPSLMTPTPPKAEPAKSKRIKVGTKGSKPASTAARKGSTSGAIRRRPSPKKSRTKSTAKAPANPQRAPRMHEPDPQPDRAQRADPPDPHAGDLEPRVLTGVLAPSQESAASPQAPL